MSGECDKCSEHAVDCKCYSKEPELAGPRATFTFDIHNHAYDYRIFSNARAMYSVLSDIQSACRKEWKYGDKPEVSKFAEEIRDMLSSVMYQIDE